MSHVKRRQLLFFAGALLAAPLARAQPLGKIWRIGILSPGSAASKSGPIAQAFAAGLRDLGYAEGKNLAIEGRYAEGKGERLADLAAELVRLKVDLIVAGSALAALAASKATSTIPIVMPAGGDLVALGLAASFAKPGGNVTGQTFFVEDLGVKGLQFLHETVPGLTQVAVLLPPDNPVMNMAVDAITSAAKQFNVGIAKFRVQELKDFADAFTAMVKQRADALLVPDNALLNFNNKTMADLALTHRLPSCGNPQFAETGGMLGYGVDFAAMFRRSAVQIDKIFKGARPGDIPIERVTTFQTVVNLKTASSLGLSIPKSILLRADRVIE